MMKTCRTSCAHSMYLHIYIDLQCISKIQESNTLPVTSLLLF